MTEDHRWFPDEDAPTPRGTLVCDVESVGYGYCEGPRFDYCPACGDPLDLGAGGL